MTPSPAFSLAAYGALLRVARAAGYSFPTFGCMHDAVRSPDLQCLLRHDIDVNMDFALRMARVEAENGVRATYFVMLRSPAYNLMSRHSTQAMAEIVSLGHEIGVHFDAAHPAAQGCDLIEEVRREADIVAQCAGAEVRAVAFHQPSAFILGNDVIIDGLINTYSSSQMAGWHYMSDSNRNWKGKDPFRLLGEAIHPKIQVLVHPMWWVSEGEGTYDVWDDAIESNFYSMQQQFLETEGAYGPPRRITLTRAAADTDQGMQAEAARIR